MLFPKLPFTFDFPELLSLPNIERSAVLEQIFLATVKGLLSILSFLAGLVSRLHNRSVSRCQSLNQAKAAVSLSILVLVFGLEISLVNVYTLASRYAIQSSSAHDMNGESYAPDSPHRPPLSL
jgi:hypothetical protein